MKRTIAALLPLSVVLSGCAIDPPQNPQGHANAATLAACRERGEAVYERQNRGTIYSDNSGRDAPFSANYTPGVVDRGLSQRYGYDMTVRDCIRNTGTQTGRTDALTAATPGAPGNPAAAPPPRTVPSAAIATPAGSLQSFPGPRAPPPPDANRP